MFDDTARLSAISWVLFEGESKTTAAKRLLCDRSTVAAWIKATRTRASGGLTRPSGIVTPTTFSSMSISSKL